MEGKKLKFSSKQTNDIEILKSNELKKSESNKYSNKCTYDRIFENKSRQYNSWDN